MHERRLLRLVRKAAEGDVAAFAKLYDAYADRIYGFVRLRVRDPRDAEELTESVFLKAYRSLPAFEYRGTPFSAWLFRIARNEVVDFVRRSTRSVPLGNAPADDLVSDECVHEQVVARADAARLREAVEALTMEQAEVIVARFFWGLTVADTAAETGRSEGAVKALQHRATRMLGKMLSEGGSDERAL